MTADARADRLARNEAAFRAANEKVREMTEAFGFVSDDERWDFVCECADVTCTEPVKLTIAEYEEIRRDPSRFFVKQGHEVDDTDAERVVERRETCYVVEKLNTDVPEETA